MSTQRVRGKTPPVDSVLPPGMFYPLAVYLSGDGGEWLVRDYAGQSGRFCVVGPWTTDTLASFRTMVEACAFVLDRAGAGSWERRTTDGSEAQSRLLDAIRSHGRPVTERELGDEDLPVYAVRTETRRVRTGYRGGKSTSAQVAEWLATVSAFELRMLQLRETPCPDGPSMPPDVAAWWDGLRISDARALLDACDALAWWSSGMGALHSADDPGLFSFRRLEWAHE